MVAENPRISPIFFAMSPAWFPGYRWPFAGVWHPAAGVVWGIRQGCGRVGVRPWMAKRRAALRLAGPSGLRAWAGGPCRLRRPSP